VSSTRSTEQTPDLLAFRIEHRAMRGDLHRLVAVAGEMAGGAAPCDPARAAALSEYVSELCDHIHDHHTLEDENLWPVIVRSAGGAADLSDLSDDHSVLDPLLADVRRAGRALAAAPADPEAAGRLAAALATLRDLLDEHIEEEERTIFPIVLRYVSVADWQGVEKKARRSGRMRFVLPRIEQYAEPAEFAELRSKAGPALLLLALVRRGYRRRLRAIYG
jgi:hemerythrin-like domain-containing protein